MDSVDRRVEIYIIFKDSGNLLYKYSVLEIEESVRDDLISGFLTALNGFAKDIGFPQGVSLIRSGSLEARFSAGKYAFSVLIIDYNKPLGSSTEPVLSGLAKDIIKSFEEKYKNYLENIKNNIIETSKFRDFRQDIDNIINQYGDETFELYQKLILIEALYTNIPQKWCLPLIEKVSNGENVLGEFDGIIKKYPKMVRAIDKINYLHEPVWEIFAIPMYRYEK